MRFDDMLATVLAQPHGDAAARTAVWRQLVDLLAQREHSVPGDQRARAFALLEEWRETIPAEVRREAARALAGRPVTAELVGYFAADRVDIAAPLVLETPLAAGEWIELLPAMAPAARALLRNRRDLDGEVRRALEPYAASDMVLERPAGEVAAASPEPQGHEQIRALVERIEAFRREREERRPAAEERQPAAREFRFETGPDGVLRWVEGAPRGALIGQSIALSAEALDFGVDGHAAGAFHRRAPFRDARLVVAGEGAAAGSWRISAVPFFEERDGRFAGYRGMARRPRRDEEAGPRGGAGEGLFGSAIEPDALRQLIHELRTPINAIAGFAEMIERQLLGPVSTVYRRRAAEISDEAGRLLRSVDDLDTAARAETDRLALEPETVDVAAILTRLHDDYVAQAEGRGVGLAIRIAEHLPALAADPIAVERMVERLLGASVGLAAPGEAVEVRCWAESDGGIAIAFSRPALLAGRSEEELLDPGYSPEGDWPDAPALGLGFALRLVRNIAREAEGTLDIERERFVLRLPTKGATAWSGERGG